MARPIVTFTSDFGLDDWFVGVCHGVIHDICPEAHVVDLSHQVPPGNVARAAFVLEAAAPDFPAGTVHVAVVDPGVGSTRRALAVRARGQLFVGPDNGILEWALCAPDHEVRSLSESRWFRQPVSRTFHGRDVFAPVAAHLARGVPLAELGAVITDSVRLAHDVTHQADGTLEGEIMFIDRFGNALTNVTREELERLFPGAPPDRFEVLVGQRRIHGFSRTYADGPVGHILAIIGSSGRLEIAQVGGHCAERLGIGEHDPVSVRRL